MEKESEMCTENKKPWLGSSISDISKEKGPWCFSTVPVYASKYHAILYQLPHTLRSPPKPHLSSQHSTWNQDHVRMPYSEKNLFPVVENGVDVIKLRWNIIKESLSKPIANSRELEAQILSYNSNCWNFYALHHFFEEVLKKEETEHFFQNLLPKIIELALQLPEILPGGLPLLKKNHNRSVSLSQLQIACLLANAFLCTFPWRKEVANTYPGVNFSRLYTAHSRSKRRSCVSEKLKCLVHYFERITTKTPIGVLTFERKFIPRSSMPRWDNTETNLGNTKIHIDSSGTIEDSQGFLQVDFANKNIGGGILGYGCVQEEIRFSICPELIVGRLFIEQLGNEEAILIIGAERYSNYTGYGDTFKWGGNCDDQTPFDEYGRKKTCICAIDATSFNKPSDQFYPSAILRELNKAYVGFSSREKEHLAPVATGNWGCGAFSGSANLKSLIQLMACSAAGRDLVYYSFGDVELRDAFYNMHSFIASNRITITQLWRILCKFSQSSLTQDKLYSFIQQAFFDSLKQPSIKSYLNSSQKKKEYNNPSPSTSTSLASNLPPSQAEDSLSARSLELETHQNMETDNQKNKQTSTKQLPDFLETPEVSSDEDIIPSSQERSILRDSTKKWPQTDLTELLDLIDGPGLNKTKKNVSHNDFPCKSMKQTEISPLEDHVIMVDSDNQSESQNDIFLLNLGEPTVKRKITDYFISKPSNSS